MANPVFSHDSQFFVYQPQPIVPEIPHYREIKPFEIKAPEESKKSKKDQKKQKDSKQDKPKPFT